jgi:hypothetical protein
MEEAVRKAAAMAKDIAPLIDGSRFSAALSWLADNKPDRKTVRHHLQIVEEAIERLTEIRKTLKEVLR